MRELLLLRHGKSAWDAGVARDFDRPLAERGRQDAPRMGRWMRSQALMPDWIISSPAARARQTAEYVLHELTVAADRVRYDGELYMANRAALLAALGRCPADTERVLLVGHNPGLDSLLEYLCGPGLPRTRHGKLMTTAALAMLSMPADWNRLQPGCARLACLMRPKQLAAS